MVKNRRRIKMEKLTKKDVLWIFASKDNNIKNHYEKYYGKYDDMPSDHILCSITKGIVIKMFDSRELLYALGDNMMLKRMAKAKRLSEELGEMVGYFDDRTQLTFYENLWSTFRNLFMMTQIDDLNKFAPKEWGKWVDEERDMWDKIEDKTKEVK